MAKVINPTVNKTHRQKNWSHDTRSKLLLPCWFAVSHADSQKEASTNNNIALTSEEMSHSE